MFSTGLSYVIQGITIHKNKWTICYFNYKQVIGMNKAADDSSGMTIANSLRTQASSLVLRY